MMLVAPANWSSIGPRCPRYTLVMNGRAAALALMVTSILFGAISEHSDGIVRLRPSAFDNLPAQLRVELERHQCTIPQLYGDGKPHNVISGAFIRKGTRDWAVLCSQDGSSSILVFDAKGTLIRSIRSMPDSEFVQGIGGNHTGYSRVITVATIPQIRAYFRYHDRATPPLSHDGIDDIYEGKASVVHYHARGRWHVWPGSD